jgi:hypothetical protein
MIKLVSVKNKEKFKLKYNNTNKVLDVFLREPERRFTYEGLRAILIDTSESQIRATLLGLERLSILEAEGIRGRPKGGERIKNYHISANLDIFKKLLKNYLDNETEIFLSSRYVNNLIKEFGFLPIYYILKNHLERSEFRRAASRALLGQQSLIDEFKNYRNFIRRELESSSYQTIIPDICEDPNVLVHPSMPRYNLFEPLSSLNLLNSIIFYRKEINSIYVKYYRHLTRSSCFSESMKKYVDIDIFLSPLTSYPVNDPIHLLFAKPFERLYDDIYIIDDADYYKMIKRAYIVYSRFSEILYSGIFYLRSKKLDNLDWKLRNVYGKINFGERYSEEKEDLDMQIEFLGSEMDSLLNIDESLDILVKSAIFYWNAASRRLDTLFDELNYLRENDKEGKYHFFSDNKGLKIVDLVTNTCIISSDAKRDLIDPYFLLDISSDKSNNPFINLKPCNIFYETGLKSKEQTYDEILAELKRQIDRWSKYISSIK